MVRPTRAVSEILVAKGGGIYGLVRFVPGNEREPVWRTLWLCSRKARERNPVPRPSMNTCSEQNASFVESLCQAVAKYRVSLKINIYTVHLIYN